MLEEDKRKWKLEILWWTITIVLCIIVIVPILINLPEYPFLWINISFILISTTLARFIFYWHLHPLARIRFVKYFLFLASILLLLYTVGRLNDFQIFMDDNGVLSLVKGMQINHAPSMARYLRNETIFFGAAALVTSFLMPFRLIISNWRQKNKGTL